MTKLIVAFPQIIQTRFKAPDHQLATTHTARSHSYCVSIAATLQDGRQKGRRSTTDKNTFYGRHVFQTGREVRPPSCLTGTGTLSTGVILPRRKANHSPSPTPQVMNAWSYIATPPYTFYSLVTGVNLHFTDLSNSLWHGPLNFLSFFLKTERTVDIGRATYCSTETARCVGTNRDAVGYVTHRTALSV
jgi:hypothetical protein